MRWLLWAFVSKLRSHRRWLFASFLNTPGSSIYCALLFLFAF